MYCAYITTISNLRKHTNADRLQCTTVFGNNVIVDLSFQLGDRVIYFPTDGQLSEEFAKDNNLVRSYVVITSENEDKYKDFQKIVKNNMTCVNTGGYMDAEKRNVNALKLRGEKSDGLILKLDVLSRYTDISKLKDGDQITTLNGYEICRKYIPQRENKTNRTYQSKVTAKDTGENISYPFFAKHIDTGQLAFNQGAFKEGDTCYITLKMHGTSARTANTIQKTTKKRRLILKKIFKIGDKEIKQFRCVSGTRRTTLSDYTGGFYGDNTFRKKYHDFFKEKLPKGMEVFYEIVGYVNDQTTIMGTCENKLIKDKEFSKQYGERTVFSYGCAAGENDCYVYRMTMTNEDGFTVELPWEQVQIECEKMGVKTVPLFEKFTYTTWDDLMSRVEKYYDGADPIGKTHVREGVVVRIDNRPSFTAYKHKNFSFKCLEGIVKDTADAPDMEEAEELIEVTENDE